MNATLNEFARPWGLGLSEFSSARLEDAGADIDIDIDTQKMQIRIRMQMETQLQMEQHKGARCCRFSDRFECQTGHI